MMRYDELTQVGQAQNPLPLEARVNILADAMTTVATARDHIDAANGFIQNSKEEISSNERRFLLGAWLLPAVAAYLLFHPTLRPLPFFVPLQYQVYWEVLFWSVFGAIGKSLISIAEDTARDVFDPRHLEKYEYKITVAPFVAAAAMAFVSLFGVTYGSTTIKLDLANPNFAVIVLLSFLFGFFAKRSIELLDSIWLKLFPPPQSQDNKKSAKTPQPSDS